MSETYESIESLKARARDLRQTCAEKGEQISHSQSLERLAHARGYRDWNTLHAAIGNRPPAPNYQLGMRVEGRYLKQPFKGEVIGVRSIGEGARFALTIRFDAPVDVITFDSMSNFRRQVQITVDQYGMTAERTRDGIPHLQLNM
ncbi:MAG: glyoxalase superfamily protein [Marinosulfonomonas sp.]